MRRTGRHEYAPAAHGAGDADRMHLAGRHPADTLRRQRPRTAACAYAEQAAFDIEELATQMAVPVLLLGVHGVVLVDHIGNEVGAVDAFDAVEDLVVGKGKRHGWITIVCGLLTISGHRDSRVNSIASLPRPSPQRPVCQPLSRPSPFGRLL